MIAVKDNHPQFAEAIQKFFIDQMGSDLKKFEHRSHETHEDKPGRLDERSYDLAEVPRGFAGRKDWPWIKAVGCTVRMRRHADGGGTDEVRHDLSGRFRGGQRFAEAVRGDRGIESMHRVLDVNFREDGSRTRERTLGDDPSWLRRFAVTLLKRHPERDSLRGKMMSCMLSTDYLIDLQIAKFWPV